LSEILLKVESVQKKFSSSFKGVMFYGLWDIFRSYFSIPIDGSKLRKGEFFAVDDVSLELKRGDVLGLIGTNGSGKSTLLKLINGIFPPDSGKITINGRVGALISVGAGFHPMLTGRENVYINGQILGMSKKEIDDKFDDIVEFADIEKFIDMPVRHYSSGMYVRLGFSIAVHSHAEILLIDEVLAVGDIAFQNKCLSKLNEITETGKTGVIFVSHNVNTTRLFCNRIVRIHKSNLTEISTDRESMDRILDNYEKSLLEKVQDDIEITPYEDDSCFKVLFKFNKSYDEKILIAFSLVNRHNGNFQRYESTDHTINAGDIVEAVFEDKELIPDSFYCRAAFYTKNFINRFKQVDPAFYYVIDDVQQDIKHKYTAIWKKQ